MDERKAYRIAVLADALHDKRERFHMLGMLNTPSDPEKRRKASIEYEIARAEFIEAEMALRTAQYQEG